MRAVYEIYSAITEVVVDRVTLDVYGDPHEFTICYDAVDAAGCTSPAYKARFVGYEGGIATVPFVVIDVISAILNANSLDSVSKNAPDMLDLRAMLLAVGYLENEGNFVNPVSPA